MQQSRLERYWRHLLAGVGIGVLVVLALAIVADGRRLAGSLTGFAWSLLPLAMGLTSVNYAVRFVKWQLYLDWVGVGKLPRSLSLGIFLAGFAMTITPGKVGELLKSYLLHRATGISLATTAPIVLAERLTDALALAILALASAAAGIEAGWPGLALVLLALLSGMALTQQRRLLLVVLRRCAELPVIRRQAGALYALYDSSYELFRPSRLVAVTGLSVVAWFAECLALWVILMGLGLPASGAMLTLAVFSLSTASLAGALSMLPGGLGAAEASLTGFLLLFSRAPMTPATAAAATLLIRFATLWFGVALGLLALIWVERQLARNGPHHRPSQTPTRLATPPAPEPPRDSRR